MHWAIFAVGAAFFQAIRFALLKSIIDLGVSPMGATYARYFFALPFAALNLGILALLFPQNIPPLNASFLGFLLLGAGGQMTATICVMTLFKRRNFTIGTVLKKTEVLQSALISFIILGDLLSLHACLAMFVGFYGVLLLSDQSERITWRGFGSVSALLGLGSGFLFAFAAVGYRGAGLALETNLLFATSVTLLCSVIFQTLFMALYLALMDPSQFTKVWTLKKRSVWIGVMSVLASLCWFAGFIQQNVALVNAVGQIEIIFVLLLSWAIFKEKVTKREYFGIICLMTSIFVILI